MLRVSNNLLFRIMFKILSQVVIEGDEGGLFDSFRFDIFNPTKFSAGGIYSLLGYISSLLFTILLIVWIVVIISGAIKIISSEGAEDKLKEGYGNIKNVFVGLTMGLAFFAVLSLIGTFLGFGNVYQWADKLAMCEGKFKYQRESEIEDTGAEVPELTCGTAGWE